MPIGFGIKKLQITAVIEDAKVRLLPPALRAASSAQTSQEFKLQGSPIVYSNQLPSFQISFLHEGGVHGCYYRGGACQGWRVRE